MEAAAIRQLGADSVVIPLAVWQQFERVLANVTMRLDVLEAVSVTGSEFLTRQQAMQFLHIGSTKLWELTKSGALETSDSTGKPLYKTSSCRDYLEHQGYSKEHVQQRFQAILRNKQKK